MKLHRTPLFLRGYRYLPHKLLNQISLSLSRARRPRFLVEAAIAIWIRRGAVDPGEFEQKDYESVEDFFLRRLRPGARPIDGRAAGDGSLVSPVDGVVVE